MLIDPIAMAGSDRSMEDEFKEQLAGLYTGDKKSVLFAKNDYFNLIEELKTAATAKSKTWRQYYILKRYEVSKFYNRFIILYFLKQKINNCHSDIKMNNIRIASLTSSKYVALNIDENLKWVVHVVE